MKLTISNDISILFKHFMCAFRAHQPFTKHTVIVPSFATASYLKEELANQLGISMGVDFSFLQPGIKEILLHVAPDTSFNNPLDQALAIECYIKTLFSGRKRMPEKEYEVYKPLFSYLLDSRGALDAKRLTSLSDSLSTQFHKYALYAKSIKQDWEMKELTHWQQGIWNHFASDISSFTPIRELLGKKFEASKYPKPTYLFGFSSIPAVYLDLLNTLSSHVDLSIYQQTPARHFWTDIKTPYEKSIYFSKLKKEKVPTLQLDELAKYFYDINPLLASLGRSGRETIKWFEEHVEWDEAYSLPKDALNFEEYREAHEGLENVLIEKEMTLLEHVKMDILSLRRPQMVYSLPDDDSISIHKVTSREREVEVLYDELIERFEVNPELKMEQVAILVANIDNYIPYIESIFKRKNSPFEIIVHDYPFSIANASLRGINLIVELAQSRWELEKLFALFEHPLFMKKFNLLQSQINKWKRWADGLKIQWGKDEAHQKEILNQNYGYNFEESKTLTWSDFFQLALKRLTSLGEEDPLTYSLASLDFSDVAHLNLLADLIQNLDKDLELLKSSRATFCEWSIYLSSLLEAYLCCDYEENFELNTLINRVKSLATISSSVQAEKFPFQTFWHHLKKDLSVFHKEHTGQHQSALSFYSLYSKPIRDAEVICVLGLSDESFPRNPIDDPLFELGSFSEKDYCPKTLDEDRYHFLQVLLLARNSVYFSYLNINPTSQKDQLPSTLLTELLSYLDRFYKMEEGKPSELVCRTHPALKFDKSYYRGPNRQTESYPLAISHYLAPKTKAVSFEMSKLDRGINLNQSLLSTQNPVVSLQKLMQFVRNPIDITLNERDQIVLEDDKWGNAEQAYVLTPLQRALLKKKLFKDRSLSLEQSALPKGIYRSALDEQLSEDLQKSESYLEKEKIDSKQFKFIELREDITAAVEFRENHWLYPALEIKWSDSFSIKLTGILEGISAKGLFLTSSSTFENIWCNWPLLLAATSLAIPFETTIYFMGSQKNKHFVVENPNSELKQFLSYYLLGRDQLCPFLPEWIVPWMQKDVATIKKKINQDIQSDFFNRPYTKALFQAQPPLNDRLLENWQKLSQTLFSQTLKSIGSQ